MKKLISFISAVLLFGLLWGTAVMAQPNLSGREQLKAERQNNGINVKANNAMQANYISLLKSKRFVFEGRRVFLLSGPNELVAATANFILVKDDHIRVCFDFPGLNGPDGLGISIQGKLINWHLDAGSAHRSITVSGQISQRTKQKKFSFTLTVGNDGSGYLHVVTHKTSFSMTGVVVGLKKGADDIGKSE